jgi:hypothetical protein
MPTTAIEEGSIFEDRAKGGMTFVYDRIAIIDVSELLPKMVLAV